MLATALAAISGLVAVLLAVEGAYYLWAVAASRRPAPVPPAAPMPDPPRVVVQVPVKDEGDVLAHALDAIAALDWPRDKLSAQVIDDSGPDGWATSARLVEALRAKGVKADHLRGEPAEHKAGALRAGLARTDAPFVAILDADFAPPPSFLRDTVPRLVGEPMLACVQARWSTRNADAGWRTRAVALALDAHFLVEQRARARQGALLSFIGTGAVWRRDAIDEAGGWTGRTLAEDVDLGVEALARGRRFALLEDPPVPQEVPETVDAFRSQQARWARGSMQCARLHAAKVLRARTLPARVRAETVFHLTHYAVHPLVFLLFLLALARPWSATVPAWLAWPSLGLALAGGFAPFAAAAARSGGWRRLRDFPTLALLGLGVSWSNTRAVLAGLLGPRGAFVRTPKGRRSGRASVRWAELALGLVGLGAAPLLALGGHFAAATAAGAFGAAFLLVAIAQ